jgi:hypothetical protein
VEIELLEKRARDLREGIRNLRDLRPAPHDFSARMFVQVWKLRRLETRLLKLRQMPLLPAGREARR